MIVFDKVKIREALTTDYMYYACMLVKLGVADGVVSGACHSSSNTLRPALQIIKTKPDVLLVSAFFLMVVPDCEYGENGVFIFADSGLEQNPDPEKLSKLAAFIKRFGFNLKTSSDGGTTHKQINALLNNCQGHPSQTLVETLTIRSMAKAVYSTSNIGHYGLAFPYYTHFTSPIRRYPDMMVHRLVSRYLLQSKAKCRTDKDELEQACVHCSECELAAQMAERDSIKEMHARWISSHLGEEFDAIISGVTEFGLFVQLTDTMTEGLVPIRTIEPHDYMQFDEENYCLIAARSGKTYTLSDKVRVRVTKVDIERKLIDFVLVEHEEYR